MIYTSSETFCKSNQIIHKKIWESKNENKYKLLNTVNNKEIILTGIASLIFNCILSNEFFNIPDIEEYIKRIASQGDVDTKREIASVLTKLYQDNVIVVFNSSLTLEQKFSQYTYTLNIKDKYYGMNFQYGTLIEISEKIYTSLRDKNIHNINEGERNLLYQNNFLYRNQSETLLLKETLKINEVSIYLILSYECNMKCIYCFEKDKIILNEDYVNNKVLETVIEDIVVIADKSKVMLTLYGGEPFVNNNISNISLIFESFNEYHNIQFRIITNGLNMQSYMKLVNRYHQQIQEFVITIDGPEHVHNSRRFDQFGNGTYKSIISNISTLINFNFNVVIRVNLDDSNYNDQKVFVCCLNELKFPHELLRIEYHRVEKKHDISFHQISLNDCISLVTTLRKVSNYQVNFEHPSFNYIESYESNTWTNLSERNYCNINNSITIDFDGKRYACNESMGIIDFLLPNKKVEPSLMNKMASEHCKTCALYLLCLGRCSLSNHAHSLNKVSICDEKEILLMLKTYIEGIESVLDYIG